MYQNLLLPRFVSSRNETIYVIIMVRGDTNHGKVKPNTLMSYTTCWAEAQALKKKKKTKQYFCISRAIYWVDN